mmetsp:Transcript_28661/g.75813  ORF Transcript_28661/g.75813 Transcript_28661/m.75813 type:complete len:209 (+) Transcript_28661:287-913(+)
MLHISHRELNQGLEARHTTKILVLSASSSASLVGSSRAAAGCTAATRRAYASAAVSGVLNVPRWMPFPPSRACALNQPRSRVTPLKPESVSARTSASPSARACALACSAVSSGSAASVLAAAAAALSGPTWRAYASAAASGVLKRPKWIPLLLSQTRSRNLARWRYTPLKPVALSAVTSTSPSGCGAAGGIAATWRAYTSAAASGVPK